MEINPSAPAILVPTGMSFEMNARYDEDVGHLAALDREAFPANERVKQ
jgi:hypothetical protein